MLRSRLIPVLLLENNQLVKSVKFADYKYIGDPLNTVRIFNEKNVDEIMLIDISKTISNEVIDYDLLEAISSQCRMPISYGGGIKNIDTIKKIISIGFEKVVLGACAFELPNLIREAANTIGSQSVSVILDVKKSLFRKQNSCFIRNGKKNMRISPVDAAMKFESLGAGEIILQSINSDGTMSGYDNGLISSLINELKCPLTVLGGLSSLNEIKLVNEKWAPLGIAAGSLFVFKGIHKAVLINYPDLKLKNSLLDQSKSIY